MGHPAYADERSALHQSKYDEDLMEDGSPFVRQTSALRSVVADSEITTLAVTGWRFGRM
jgi:hypothetical protein